MDTTTLKTSKELQKKYLELKAYIEQGVESTSTKIAFWHMKFYPFTKKIPGTLESSSAESGRKVETEISIKIEHKKVSVTIGGYVIDQITNNFPFFGKGDELIKAVIKELQLYKQKLYK